MQYRRFGKLDFKVSALGFGCMRLPILGDYANINEPEAIRMIRHGIDNGVNYLDSAYGYHGGNSERVLGRALLDGYRQKVKIATKMPVRSVTQYADLDRILNEQLSKLHTDHIDFYLLHGLERNSYEFSLKLEIFDWAEGATKDGRIGCLGFSFHDDIDTFKKIIDGYPRWSFCQVQYNYRDQNYQAGTEGVRYAAERGLGVVVMEPLLGGKLGHPPEAIKAIFEQTQSGHSAADWALQWVWNQPEVSVVLSGMSTMRHVVENLASADRSGVGRFGEDDFKVIEQAREAYTMQDIVRCTECRYCMPCRNDVDIPLNFLMSNRAVGFQELDHYRLRYTRADPSQMASACIECRECEDKCPQHIPIADWMPIVDDVLGKEGEYDPALAPVG